MESRHDKTIEQVFAKLKALLRKAAERTVGALWNRIGISLDAFTPTECANYFAAVRSRTHLKIMRNSL